MAPMKFVVHVVEARNLTAADFGSTSDPYVLLSFGDETHQTEFRSSTLNPEWHQQFTFRVTDQHAESLNVRVLDHDMIGSDEPIGQLDFSVANINGRLRAQQLPEWFKLTGEGCGEGELRLGFSLDAERGTQRRAVGQVAHAPLPVFARVARTEHRIRAARRHGHATEHVRRRCRSRRRIPDLLLPWAIGTEDRLHTPAPCE